MAPQTRPFIAALASTRPQLRPPVMRSMLFSSVPTIDRNCTGKFLSAK